MRVPWVVPRLQRGSIIFSSSPIFGTPEERDVIKSLTLSVWPHQRARFVSWRTLDASTRARLVTMSGACSRRLSTRAPPVSPPASISLPSPFRLFFFRPVPCRVSPLPTHPPPPPDADAVASEAQDLERRIHTVSGRIAQLDMNLRTCCDDLTAMSDSMLRLRKQLASLPADGADGEKRVSAEKALYQAQLVMRGTGPAGALDGYLKPPRNGKFMSLFLGAAVDVTSQRQENRLKVKEEYYSFRDKSTVPYVAWPLILLYLNGERRLKIENGAPHAGISLVTIFPVLVQFYWVWMLYFYAALALRENVLVANGSSIKRWWINHHYYSMGMCLVVLTMDVQSDACLTYMSRFLVFTTMQGTVMLVQNRYQRLRMYTRVAMGKANVMDVAGGEMGGNAGQLKLLYPLLFFLQALQMYFGVSVLLSVAIEHGLVRKELFSGIQVLEEVFAPVDFARIGLQDKIKSSLTRKRPKDMDVADFFKEWQAPTAGALFIVMGAGNFRATIQTYFNKRQYAKKAKMA